MSKSRGRGKVDDSDLKRLYEENKELKKRIRVLDIENQRVRKDIQRGKIPTETVTESDAEYEEFRFIKRQENLSPKVTINCPLCGSSDVDKMELPTREGLKVYVTCFDCNKRSKIDGRKT